MKAGFPKRVKPCGSIIGFVWEQFGAYHIDRLEAVGRTLHDSEYGVVGIEVASRSETYEWEPSQDGVYFRKVTLFAGRNSNHISEWAKALAMIQSVRRERINCLFISGYEAKSRLLLALYARLTGRRVIIMNDSKFDDKPRRATSEFLKSLWMLPYNAAFASGRRAKEYLYFQGFPDHAIVEGYDTVDLVRLRTLAEDVAPPLWEDRCFVIVARLVPKKNLSFALNAYAEYRKLVPQSDRDLLICGSGPLYDELNDLAKQLGLSDHIRLLGNQTQAQLAQILARALCLILPSKEEQWGLVANEALAFALPLLVSDAVGARDSLVSTLRNGFVLGVDDLAAWTSAMLLIGSDQALWQRLHAGSASMAHAAHTTNFVISCLQLGQIKLPA